MPNLTSSFLDILETLLLLPSDYGYRSNEAPSLSDEDSKTEEELS